jgi:hypothetical protein
MQDHRLKEELANFIVEVINLAADRLEGRLRRIIEGQKPLGMPPIPKPDPDPRKSRYMDFKRLGAYLGMNPQSARKMLERHRPPKGVVIRIGQRKLLVDVAALEEWLAGKSNAP